MLRRVVVYVSCVVVLAVGAAAQPDVTGLGPQVGGRVPDFSGVDQFGRTQSLQTVVGREGAMLVFFRSADW